MGARTRLRRLDAESNFLDLYLHHVGHSDIPRAYHKWAALSLVAALVRDQVWVEKYVDIPLYPHVFIWLVGRSGTGKDIAATIATNFLRDIHGIRVYPGKTTAANLITWLRKKSKNGGQDHRCWYVSMELAQDIGTGPIADQFIKFATAMYTRKSEYKEGTRAHGQHVLKNPLMNWLAGTTHHWLAQSVTKDDIAGGFFARICPIEVEVNPDQRTYQPTIPSDYAQCREWLYERCELYAKVEGIFDMTPNARRIDEQWFMNRPSPSEDSGLLPTFQRQPEQVLKLAQLYAICDVTSQDQPLWIHSRHIIQAQRDAALFLTSTRNLLHFAASKQLETKLIYLIADTIKQGSPIRRSTLLSRLYKEGVTSELLTRVEQTLVKAGEIKIASPGETASANPFYLWRGKQIRMDLEEEVTPYVVPEEPSDEDDPIPDSEEEAI